MTGFSGTPHLRFGWGVLALPGTLFLIIFYAWPVAEMMVRAFTEPSVGLDNFATFVTSPIGPRSLFLTLQTGFMVTLVCLVVGYPLAYALVMAPPRVAAVLLTLLLVSLWLNIIARTFAWQVVLRDTGVINRMLLDWGLIQSPISMIRTPFAVMVGMTHILLPSMVLPLYVIMGRIDPELPRAAASLGAGPYMSFVRVFFRLSLPGVFAGCLLVFVQAIGFYITPFLLGGGSYQMISLQVVNQIQHLQWGYGSAMALILIAAVLSCLAIAARFVRIGDVFGAAVET